MRERIYPEVTHMDESTIFIFDTEEEVSAFIHAVNYVNDSSIIIEEYGELTPDKLISLDGSKKSEGFYIKLFDKDGE